MNTQQLPLLTDTNIARRDDPQTSHDGDRRVTSSGDRAEQQLAVLAWVREYPGRTSRELSDIATRNGAKGLDHEVFHKRLPEIAKDHDRRGNAKVPLVKKGRARACTVTQHKAATWYEFNVQIPEAELL